MRASICGIACASFACPSSVLTSAFSIAYASFSQAMRVSCWAMYTTPFRIWHADWCLVVYVAEEVPPVREVSELLGGPGPLVSRSVTRRYRLPPRLFGAGMAGAVG